MSRTAVQKQPASLWPPCLVLGVLALVLGYGWSLQPGPDTLEEAVAELIDGDADRAERLDCLLVVRDRGLEAAALGDVPAGLLSAMAALALGDREAFCAAAERIRGRTPYLPGGQGAAASPEVLRRAALGEPYLRSLLLGHAAANEGHEPEARTLFQRAQLSALFFGAKAAAAEARAGLERLR